MIDGQISLTDLGVVPKEWQYDEDTGMVMCRCPVCEGHECKIIRSWQDFAREVIDLI